MMIFMGASPPFSGDPIPCVPFPLIRGRGGKRRGAAPFLDTPLGEGGLLTPAPRWGGKGEFKGGEASLPYPSPSPLKERGIKG